MSNRYFLAITAMAVVAAPPAFATAVAPAPAAKAPAATAPKPVTRAEFLATFQNRFATADTNHDGFLDTNEIAAAQQKELEQARANEQREVDAKFDKLDINHDGQLSKAEFRAIAPALQMRTTPQQVIGAIDANKDGKISLQEYEAAPLSNFNKLDANHDGIVTPQEAQAARAQKK